jgi:hypothetical protein
MDIRPFYGHGRYATLSGLNSVPFADQRRPDRRTEPQAGFGAQTARLCENFAGFQDGQKIWRIVKQKVNHAFVASI